MFRRLLGREPTAFKAHIMDLVLCVFAFLPCFLPLPPLTFWFDHVKECFKCVCVFLLIVCAFFVTLFLHLVVACVFWFCTVGAFILHFFKNKAATGGHHPRVHINFWDLGYTRVILMDKSDRRKSLLAIHCVFFMPLHVQSEPSLYTSNSIVKDFHHWTPMQSVLGHLLWLRRECT